MKQRRSGLGDPLGDLVKVAHATKSARPLRLEFGAPYINNSPRLGAFYVLAGLVYILVSLAVPYTEYSRYANRRSARRIVS